VLPLGRDRSISLRHMAVIVEPVVSFEPGAVRYRVIDLRSSHGLTTEEGKEVGAIRCDGPCFVAAGRYAFYFFVTGDPTDFRAPAKDAWACVPPRIYEQVQPRLAMGSVQFQKVGLGPMSLGGELTTIQTLRPPTRLELGRLLGKGETPVGELMLEGEDCLQRIEVGPAALEDGILIGRSERCDTGTAIDSRRLSRVHLLILAVGGELYAFDTASSNGSFAACERWVEFRVAHLPARAVVNLAETVLVRWRQRLALGSGQ
jgi:hypothetical protein